MARPRKTNSRKPSQKKKDCVTCGDVDFMKNVTKRGRKPKAAAHKTSVTASMTFERNNNVLHFDQLSLTTIPSLPEERFDLVNSCVQKNRSETRLNVVEFNGDIVQQSLPLMMGPMESVFHQQHRIAAGCSVMPSQTTPTGRCSNWDLHEFIECVYRFVVFILHDRTVKKKHTCFRFNSVIEATTTAAPIRRVRRKARLFAKPLQRERRFQCIHWVRLIRSGSVYLFNAFLLCYAIFK